MWPMLIAAGASLLSGAISSRAGRKAAAAQRKASEDSIAEQRRQADLTRSDFAPYREVGANALQTLASEVNQRTTAADVMQDPGYQFGLDQGQQAIDRRVAAGGGRVSGQAIKAAARFGTNYATTGYGATDQRRETRLNRLAALANVGQTSTGAVAADGRSTANAVSGVIQNQGDNAGNAALYQGGVWSNTINQLSSLYGRSNGAGGGSPAGEAARYPGGFTGVS